MNIKVSSIADRGVSAKERLVLKVIRDCDIGEFAIFKAAARDRIVTSDVRNVFWFPDKRVVAGDLVVLYTKAGTPSDKALQDGRTAYFFYLAAGGTIWNEDDAAAVVLHVSEWISFFPSDR